MLAWYSTVVVHTTEPDELGKARPTTLFGFARARDFPDLWSNWGCALGRTYMASALGGFIFIVEMNTAEAHATLAHDMVCAYDGILPGP